MGSDKEIKITVTKCPFCEETMFPQKVDLGDNVYKCNVYKCTECGSFLELEEEEKIVVFEPEMDLDPTIH